jgi:hypothetical protein
MRVEVMPKEFFLERVALIYQWMAEELQIPFGEIEKELQELHCDSLPGRLNLISEIWMSYPHYGG